jgi:hypothetical protein
MVDVITNLAPPLNYLWRRNVFLSPPSSLCLRTIPFLRNFQGQRRERARSYYGTDSIKPVASSHYIKARAQHTLGASESERQVNATLKSYTREHT